MGLWSWLFPSADDRVAAARGLIAKGRWGEARLDLLELDHPDAPGLVAACETELAKINLEEAVRWAMAGDEARVQQHLELAESFDHGGIGELSRDARRRIRELRAERSEAERRATEEANARLMAADPLGLTGGPSWLQGAAPTDMVDPTDDEAEARLALIVEGYPDALKASVGGLGAAFARAILDHEDGRPDLALQGLHTLPDGVAVVRWERARAAYTLGDPLSAARELREFATLAGGHFPMGRQHSGVLLTMCLAEAGRADEALRVLRSLRAAEPRLGGALYAQLLQATGDLPEAEKVLADLIRSHPKDTGLYKLLAGVRLQGGDRPAARAALEAAMDACSCPPGKCGYQPPDLGVVRGLATLYLEDGAKPDRGAELARQALQLVKEPTWEDAYLQALLARAGGSPDARRLAEALWEHTPKGDSRHARLTQFLPA